MNLLTASQFAFFKGPLISHFFFGLRPWGRTSGRVIPGNGTMPNGGGGGPIPGSAGGRGPLIPGGGGGGGAPPMPRINYF